MEFSGEEIIAKRVQAEQQMDYTIEHEISIDGVPYSFERRELLDRRMSIVLPKSFIEMDIESARLKYPAEQRPEFILCSSDGCVDIALSQTGIFTEQ